MTGENFRFAILDCRFIGRFSILGNLSINLKSEIYNLQFNDGGVGVPPPSS
jgi:hypothetical protein